MEYTLTLTSYQVDILQELIEEEFKRRDEGTWHGITFEEMDDTDCEEARAEDTELSAIGNYLYALRNDCLA